MDRVVERPSSWYLDLNLLSRYVNDTNGGGRVYHHTAPVAMVAALRTSLGVLLDEGIEAAQRRHAECGQSPAGRAGRPRAGAPGEARPSGSLSSRRSTCPTASTMPRAARELLLSYGIEIGAGAGRQTGLLSHIGCMGHTARRRNVFALLGAMKEVLGR